MLNNEREFRILNGIDYFYPENKVSKPEADEYGGEDKREKQEKERTYSDKGGHKARSEAHDSRPGGHRKHNKD